MGGDREVQIPRKTYAHQACRLVTNQHSNIKTLSVTEPPVVTDNERCAESAPLNERALIGSRLVATGAGL